MTGQQQPASKELCNYNKNKIMQEIKYVHQMNPESR
jgi:hypothetical protein